MATAIVATGFGGPEVLSVVDTEVRPPGPGEVTIQVKAAGVNPFDYKRYSGAFGRDPAALPIPLGFEVSGVVTAAAPGAAGPAGLVQVGDEVIARSIDGGYASAVTVAARYVVPKPAALGWEQAAGLLVTGGTAVHALAVTRVGPGDTVLIHGVSGGVGLTAAQIAIARGAHVIGTASTARHDQLKGYGVTPVAYGPGLAHRVTALAPHGVDAAIDTVGTDEAIDVSVALVKDPSRIVTIAGFARGAKAGIALIGGGPGADPGTDIRAKAWAELTSLTTAGKLDVVVAQTFPLTEAAAAHQLVATGHAGGKVILIP
jgi:NADPH2:quinone reductase